MGGSYNKKQKQKKTLSKVGGEKETCNRSKNLYGNLTEHREWSEKREKKSPSAYFTKREI